MADGRRVGLVLGAGGPVGHAFHAGVLAALQDGGWDARDAAVIVGTSIGAITGALLRAGVSPEDLYARVTGRPMSEEGEARAGHGQGLVGGFRLDDALDQVGGDAVGFRCQVHDGI